MELFDDAIIGFFRITMDGRFLYVNKAFATILKYDSPQDIILSVKDIEAQLYVTNIKQLALLDIIRREDKLSNYEMQFLCKDGSIVTTLLNMQIRKDEMGNEIYIDGFINDITQLKEKEATLKESEERWLFALEGSEDGVWDWDLQTNKIYRSKQYKVMRGLNDDDITDTYEEWADSLHPDDKEFVINQLEKHIRGEIPLYIAEYRIRKKDGSYMWIHERGKATRRSSEGKALRMVGTQRDVTRERNNQDALLYQKSSYECLFNHSPDAIVQFDEEENIVDANYEFLRLFGYTYDEIKGKNINDIIDPFHQLDSYLTYAGLTKGDCQFRDTVRYDKYGYPIRVFVKGVPIVINDKTIGGYAIYTDVGPMKEAEEQIKKQQKILESHFKYSPDAVVYLDMDLNIVEINRKFTSLFGYTAEEALGRNIEELIIDEDHLAESQEINQLALQNKEIEMDTVRRRKDGTLVDVCIRGGPTFVDGKIIGYHAIFTDISGRKEAEEKIKYLSYHDNLTGLYNRAYFEESLKNLHSSKHLPLSMIIGDVNGLKLTNDVFGHLEGDQLLIRIAEILRRACRKEDLICRWGGDEFAILLPKTDKATVKMICQKIYHLCDQSEATPIKISISLGYAVKDKNGQPITDVIKEAEEQMYRNKLLESKSARSHIIHSLQKSLHERSYETEEHLQRVKDLSITLGKALNLDNDQLNELGLLAILHDIGKMAISDTILKKPGKLTPEEWEEMKRHCEIGYRIAETSPELIHIAKYILFHHERWDGKGYPHELKGDEIPLLSRIISIIDAYDVMTHARVYKEPLSHHEAICEIKKCSGSQFDPRIASRFIEIFQ